MRYIVGLLVIGLTLTLGGQADAQVISFDELTPAPTQNPILGSVVCAAGTGFRFVSDHFHVIGASFTVDFTSNGTSHIGYEFGRGFPMVMERVGGGTFSLHSLDAAEFYSPPSPNRPDAQMLTITGHQLGGGMVSHTMNLDGIRDGQGGVPDFQHFVLPATFVNLTSVVFTGLRPGGIPGGVAVDNLEYQLAVPEALAPCVAIPLPPDTPTVTITNPVAGNVAGTVLVEATATDDVGVTGVQFKVDGVNLGAPDVTPPYSISWDTTTLPDGPHTITAEASDIDANVGTASEVVTVLNHPIVNTSPHYVDLDGVDDYLQVADANALSFGNGTADTPLTLEMWFRPDAMGKHQLIGKWGEISSQQEYKLQIAAGTIRLDLRDHSANATVAAFTTAGQSALIGTWHHLAVTYDGRGGALAAAGITIYIDGVAVPVTRTNHASYVAMENLTAPVLIGREGASWKQYDGGLDEIRMWNVARSAGDIQLSMTTELSGLEAGLVAYWKLNEGAGATVTDDSPGSHTATLFNGTAWIADGPMGPPVPDTTAPSITDIVASSLTDVGVTISFNTSEPATAWISYNAGTACPCIDVYSAGPGTSHVVTLSGLSPNTPYQFVVRATDAATNLGVSSAMTFSTLAPQPDTTLPTVGMQSPAAGNVVGTVQVAATASDNVGVVSVQFKLDGVNLGAADVSAPYTLSWDTTAVADGPHTITAEAVDAANNIGVASVAVTVRNHAPASSPHYVDLDGTDDHLLAADANGLSFGNGSADTPFTFEMWLRPDVMTRHQLIGKWGESSNQEYKVSIASGTIQVDLRDQSAGAAVAVFTGSQVALTGAWHHLAVTYDGRGGATAANGLTVYIDGVAVAVTRINNPAYVAMENLAAPLQIGREGPGWRQYNGGLDELRMWTVARSASEIQSSMMAELLGSETGLAAYWKFNEGEGTMATDASPADHTVTLINGAAWLAGGPIP